MAAALRHFPRKPRFGHTPIAFHRGWRNMQNITDFFDGSSTKHSWRHDLLLLFVDFCQARRA
jgi:hypothetical protein